MMCVPPGILCAPNKMTSSQMEWLELSHRSGSEREDLKGRQRGNESLNSLPPSLGTLRGRAVHQHRRVFSKAAPRLCRPKEVASEHSLARVPKGQLQRVHLPCTWLLPGPVRSAKVKFLLSPAQKCRVGETGNSCFIRALYSLPTNAVRREIP